MGDEANSYLLGSGGDFNSSLMALMFMSEILNMYLAEMFLSLF